MEFRMKGMSAFTTEAPYGELTISGEDEHGFRPYQLLVSSIAACSGGVLRKIILKRRLELKDMQITADVKRNEAEPREIEVVHLHFTIHAPGVSDSQMEKMVATARKNCPIVQSVAPQIQVTETFTLE